MVARARIQTSSWFDRSSTDRCEEPGQRVAAPVADVTRQRIKNFSLGKAMLTMLGAAPIEEFWYPHLGPRYVAALPGAG